MSSIYKKKYIYVLKYLVWYPNDLKLLSVSNPDVTLSFLEISYQCKISDKFLNKLKIALFVKGEWECDKKNVQSFIDMAISYGKQHEKICTKTFVSTIAVLYIVSDYNR